jgi:hypothetical protein
MPCSQAQCLRSLRSLSQIFLRKVYWSLHAEIEATRQLNVDTCVKFQHQQRSTIVTGGECTHGLAASIEKMKNISMLSLPPQLSRQYKCVERRLRILLGRSHKGARGVCELRMTRPAARYTASEQMSKGKLRKPKHTGTGDPVHGLAAGPAAAPSRLSGLHGLFLHKRTRSQCPRTSPSPRQNRPNLRNRRHCTQQTLKDSLKIRIEHKFMFHY